MILWGLKPMKITKTIGSMNGTTIYRGLMRNHGLKLKFGQYRNQSNILASLSTIKLGVRNGQPVVGERMVIVMEEIFPVLTILETRSITKYLNGTRSEDSKLKDEALRTKLSRRCLIHDDESGNDCWRRWKSHKIYYHNYDEGECENKTHERHELCSIKTREVPMWTKSGGLLAGIHGLFSGRNCYLVRRITCEYPWPELEGKRFGMIQERFGSSAWCLRDRMSMPTQVLVEGSDGVTNVTTLINLRVAFHAINARRLPLALLVYTLVRPSVINDNLVTTIRLQGLFDKQKRPDPTLIDWYRPLRIVLSIEDKFNYLEQPLPPAPVAPAGVKNSVCPASKAGASSDLSEISRLLKQEEGKSVTRNMRVCAEYNMHSLGKTMTTSSANNSVFKGFFEKQKLSRPNFIDWYRKQRIVLSIEDKLNYLEQPLPHAPVAPAGQQVAPEILAAHTA
ncbi:hypothetical protein Tco_0200504 [Tanacetum coccineum]